MAKRFIFRQIQFQDIAIFLKDGEIRAPNHPKPQKCHQASYSEIKERREQFKLPDGSCINDYVQFYFSPITAFNYTICKGNVDIRSPENQLIGKTSPLNRLFIVYAVRDFIQSRLHYYFSDTALNSTNLEPNICSDLNKINDVVDWELFDEPPIIATIPEIGYNGVHSSFRNIDDNPKYGHRKEHTMAEFLVKTALPLNFVKCLVINPRSRIREKEWLKDQIYKNRYAIPIYENAYFFFNLP